MDKESIGVSDVLSSVQALGMSGGTFSSVQAIAIKMEGLGLRMRNTKCSFFLLFVLLIRCLFA